MAISEEGYRKMIYFHLPGLLLNFMIFIVCFLPLFREHREYFYDWCGNWFDIMVPRAGLVRGGGRAGLESNTKPDKKLYE